MTISYVSTASAEATSISSMPTHQAGDTLIMFAWNNASNTVPTVPSGWTTLWSNNGSSRGSVVAMKRATSGGETSGTWTNATALLCSVYRDASNYVSVGAGSRTNAATTTTISYSGSVVPGRTGSSPTIEAWMVAFGGCSSNSTDFETAPTGMTNRGSLAGSAAFEITSHDSNGVLTSWSNTNRTNSGSVSYHTYVFEIFDTGISKNPSISVEVSNISVMDGPSRSLGF